MSVTLEDSLIEKVNVAIEQLRPFLHADGGDMEFVEITSDYVVKVRLKGACRDCSMSAMTLKAGIEDAIRVAAPQVRSVVAVDEIENV